jgi:hypothetical protein
MIQRRRKGAIAECCKEVLRQLRLARLDFGRRMVRLTENHVLHSCGMMKKKMAGAIGRIAPAV